MEKETRQRLERLTQQARRLLEQEFREQLEGRYDILLDGRIPLAPGAHLSPRERVLWDKLVAAVAHKRSQGITAAAAVAAYLREAAFHTLNRFVALKMLEARKLVQECISRGEDSAGFKEFIALAPGLVALPDKGYRLYVETIFDEIAQEVRALFDRRDAATLLWPRRQALLDLLAALNDPEVAAVWGEDETIGWVYQYFNGEDERRQMRAESQAPRNSRELAVRNQFFTPRYVVQFLTDNSLGRTWCEMRGGDTQLAHLDYLVKPEEGFEERAPKDPRDLRVLDPACGSGHFLLYAFDLLAGDPTRSFFGIYEEAWRGGAAVKSEVTGRTLKEDYDSELALRRAVPELVLKHNLHGLDIDPRAAQMAALALWMRAQRAYNDHKVAAQDRPLIGRTNIVTAEPMPGDRSMVAEFASTLRPRVLGELFQRMVEEMRLAGELGSLLKIDRALQSAVAKAREQFLREQRETQTFLPGLDHTRAPHLEFDMSGVSDESFFDSAEERIVQALKEYAAGAPASMSVRRQLFVDDSAEGIAFIELMRRRFDVVVMNPPFGKGTPNADHYIRANYPNTWKDLYAAFFDAAESRATPDGLWGAISSSLFLYTKQLRDWRESISRRRSVLMVLELGGGVLDGATVDTALSLHVAGSRSSGATTEFFDLSAKDEERRPQELLNLCAPHKGGHLHNLEDFLAIETTPWCYHTHSRLLDTVRQNGRLDPDFGSVASGNTTFDNERFLRLWWEVETSEIHKNWFRYEKGGRYQPFFSPPALLIDWCGDGKEMRAAEHLRYGTDARSIQSITKWFQPGLTYPRVSSIGFGPRIMAAGSIFSTESISIFPREAKWSLAILSLAASTWGQDFVDIFGRHRKTENRSVSNLPVSEAMLRKLDDEASSLAYDATLELLKLETHIETSPVFSSVGTDGHPSFRAWEERRQVAVERLKEIAKRLDDAVSRVCFGVVVKPTATPRQRLVRKVMERFLPKGESWGHAVCSEAMGVAFGRYTPNCMRSRSELTRFDLFAPIPGAGPWGRLREGDDIDGTFTIMVHDPGHPSDVSTRISAVLSSIDGVEAQLCASLATEELGRYVATAFFEHHITAFSAFRRAAPIYWQLATASGSYSVWLYIHRTTGDTLFRVLNDFVGPKLDHEKAKLDGLTQEAGGNPSAAQRREIEQQETFVGELQALKTEVGRVAPLWKPNLDDGVILNFAPLWRLVPQSRSWQGECKKAWDKLVAGDYDWAHLAMHLWPERVVPKCIDDRSLAIAHGLEEVFWHEDDSGTWRKSRVDDATVQKLIQERTSTTVKAALQDLLSAAAPTASKGRKAKGRSASPRTSAPKPAPAAARTTTPDTVLDEATLRAVKAAIASVADGASKADVLAATGLSDTDWNKAIAALLDRGDVTRTGQKRGTRYHVVSGGGE